MKKTKKIVAVLLTITLFCFLAVAPSAVSAVESNAEAVEPVRLNNVYVKQQESVTCTLAAATTCLREILPSAAMMTGKM